MNLPSLFTGNLATDDAKWLPTCFCIQNGVQIASEVDMHVGGDEGTLVVGLIVMSQPCLFTHFLATRI